MRASLPLLLMLMLTVAGAQRAEAASTRPQNRGVAYFEDLIRAGHLGAPQLRRMLETHRSTGRLGDLILFPAGPAEIVRQRTSEAHLREAGPALLTFLTGQLEQLERVDTRIQELEDTTKAPPLRFIRLEPAGTVELPWSQSGSLSFTLEGPLEVLDRHVTQAQWLARMGGNPSHFQLGPNHPVESVGRDRQRFLRRLDEEAPGYRHRLPTDEEWMYYASDQGRDVHQIAHDFDWETILEHAWMDENAHGEPREVATRKPTLLAGEPIHDVLGLVADSTAHPHYLNSGMGGWFGTRWPWQRQYRYQNVTMPISDPDWAFGLRVVREPR